MVKNSLQSSPIESVSREVADLAARVSQSVDIYDVRLIDQAARLTEVKEKLPKLRRFARNHRAIRDNEKGSVRVDIAFAFEMADEAEESKLNPPLSIHATFSLSYQIAELDKFGDEEINAFAQVNGAYNAWPFWREYVYSTMSRMGLPPITLPVFRIVESKAEAKIDSDSKQG